MMMFMLLSAILVLFAGLCTFGVPYLLTGPRMFDDFSEKRDQQIMGSLLVTAMLAIVLAPFVSSGLISDVGQAQVMAEAIKGLVWG